MPAPAEWIAAEVSIAGMDSNRTTEQPACLLLSQSPRHSQIFHFLDPSISTISLNVVYRRSIFRCAVLPPTTFIRAAKLDGPYLVYFLLFATLYYSDSRGWKLYNESLLEWSAMWHNLQWLMTFKLLKHSCHCRCA